MTAVQDPTSETAADASAPRPLHLHILRFVPVVIILGLLVHLLLPRLGTLTDSFETMRSLRPVAIALAVAFEALSYVANGNVLRSVLDLAGAQLAIRRAVAIELGAGAVSLVAAGPLGFGASIYRWTRGRGISADAAMLSSWLPSMFDSIALVVFALISAVELLITHRLSRTTLIALTVVVSGLTLAIAAVIVLLTRSDWMIALVHRVAALGQRVRPSAKPQAMIDAAERAVRTWQTMRRGGWIAPMTSSFLVLTFDLLCLRYAFVATGYEMKFHLLLAGYGVPILLGRASFIPGGVAVIEVAMAALFAGLGAPANVAVVAVLTYRLISFWIPALIGIPVAITLQARNRRSSR